MSEASHNLNSSANSSNRLKILSRGDACWSCRRRKLRCDGGKPVCGPCRRYQRSQECVFDEKPLTETQVLEARITELEQSLQRATSTALSRPLYPSFGTLGNALVSFDEMPIPTPDIGMSPGDVDSLNVSIPTEVTDGLIKVFFTYICHFNFAADVNKFRLSLSLPEDHPNRPHPALLNAIYCVSCHYSYAFNPDVKEFEPIFYDRAQRHLDDSLAHVDRLFDFLTATALLAQYNLMKGNLAKGTYLASSAMSFAVGCGLHQMNVNDPNGSLAPGMTLLPPPQSNAEYVERVNVFSTVFQLERQACLEVGVPLSQSDELITTPWPFAMMGSTLPLEAFQPSVRSLYSPDGKGASVIGDCVLAIRGKAVALLERANRHTRHPSLQQMTSVEVGMFWDGYQTLDQALVKFRESLPPIDTAFLEAADPSKPSHTELYSDNEAYRITFNYPNPRRDWFFLTLIFARATSAAAMIQLHGIFAERDDSEAAVVLGAARDIAQVIRAIGCAPAGIVPLDKSARTDQIDTELSTFKTRRHHKIVGYCIYIAAQVLHREWRRRMIPPLFNQEALEIKRDFELLRRALRMMTEFYPGLQTYDADIERISSQ